MTLPEQAGRRDVAPAEDAPASRPELRWGRFGAPAKVGEWELDLAANRIRKGGESRTLEPRVAALLGCFARRPGEVISRQDLIDEVWGGAFINDETVSRAVARLRKALGDETSHPRYVETISKKGYRLIAPVSSGAGASPARQRDPSLIRAAPGASAPYPARRRRAPAALWWGAFLAALLGVSGYSAIRPHRDPVAHAPGASTSEARVVMDAWVLPCPREDGIISATSPDAGHLLLASHPPCGARVGSTLPRPEADEGARLRDRAAPEPPPAPTPERQMITVVHLAPGRCETQAPVIDPQPPLIATAVPLKD